MSDICWRQIQTLAPARRKEEESHGDRNRNRRVMKQTNKTVSIIMTMMKKIHMEMISYMWITSNLVK